MPLIFSVTDDALHRLQAVFPDSLILAALDIIDRENGNILCSLLIV